MKTRKAISFLTAAVMAVSALPILSVSAEENTYALGDVDMDGYVTGHDAAMVSRYVLDDGYTLTEEQLTLADVNGDGAVDQADADWIFENKTYGLGELLKNGHQDVQAAYISLVLHAESSVGKKINIVEKPAVELSIGAFQIYNLKSETPEVYISENGSTEMRLLDPVKDAELYDEICRLLVFNDHRITQLEYNLLDVDMDNKITADDAYALLHMYAADSVGNDIEELFFNNGKYYIEVSSIGKSVQDE